VPPATHYAKSGDVSIAYQVIGSSSAGFLHRLASFSRLIFLDRGGTGLSDAVADLSTLEQRMDDVRAVMDAAGSERAAVLSISEGGP
jgi:pimeloyl-ACP methyl ester carboxylesterase